MGLHGAAYLHFFLTTCHRIAIISKRAIWVSSVESAKYGRANTWAATQSTLQAQTGEANGMIRTGAQFCHLYHTVENQQLRVCLEESHPILYDRDLLELIFTSVSVRTRCRSAARIRAVIRFFRHLGYNFFILCFQSRQLLVFAGRVTHCTRQRLATHSQSASQQYCRG